MEKEFVLSDKEIEANLNDSSQGKFRKSDVKEFVRLLKEKSDILHLSNGKQLMQIEVKDFNKLAGDLK